MSGIATLVAATSISLGLLMSVILKNCWITVVTVKARITIVATWAMETVKGQSKKDRASTMKNAMRQGTAIAAVMMSAAMEHRLRGVILHVVLHCWVWAP